MWHVQHFMKKKVERIARYVMIVYNIYTVTNVIKQNKYFILFKMCIIITNDMGFLSFSYFLKINFWIIIIQSSGPTGSTGTEPELPQLTSQNHARDKDAKLGHILCCGPWTSCIL